MNDTSAPTNAQSTPPVEARDETGQGKGRQLGWLADLVKQYWKELLGFALGGGSSFVKSFWNSLLPLPSELVIKGRFWTFILSLLAVLSVGVIFFLLRDVTHKAKIISFLLLTILCVTMFTFCVFQFHVAERLWKDPKQDFDILYNIYEPFVYGLAFSFLTAAISCAFALITAFYSALAASRRS